MYNLYLYIMNTRKKITPSHLKNTEGNKMLKEFIRTEIEKIDIELESANLNGYNYIIHTLPKIAKMPGINMEPRKARVFIYSEILREYKQDRGFDDVILYEQNGQTFMKICWGTDMDDDEYQKRLNYIKIFMPRGQ